MLESILIFKTNITTETDLLIVKAALDTHHQIERWTIDQTDVDCVLRVISHHLSYADVNRLISGLNYNCEELTY
ncbi:hypothetical protein SAMN05518672_103718 [Chitinophaga sp. CF118]|uniref:hypothetical protein n=1 Tax=Chitinophaga sp. CF118 TaxID=1884367 RepID=UPI0008E6A392|nr:hypothetical protein [Chitinophaga sp. CF118]SFD88992.1 hypothetical protein SAMN05518672_103718 [Chitinophaga sp. CF118]